MTNVCGCGRTISANKSGCASCLSGARTGDGVLEILNVGAGDVKITFEKGNEAEAIRARRIVKDMLRRGYALIVEVERDGEKKYERVRDFDAERGEYIIADFDPLEAREADMEEGAQKLSEEQDAEDARRDARRVEAAQTPPSEAPIPEKKKPDAKDPTKCSCGMKWRHRGSCKGVKKGPYSSSRRIPMEGAKATAIGRSAGG